MAEKAHPESDGLPGLSYNIRKPVRMIFPVGIFFMLFFMESLIAAGASLAYFFYIGKGSIAEIESNTRSYSMPIAEAFGNMAEMCYRTNNFSRLRTIFREKIEQQIIDEAFFVLKDGKVIAHSDPATYERLKGNLASDELAYNMDLILRPAVQKSRDVFFTEYNIVSKPAPFKREYRILLKSYFYQNIDSTGWLVSRAVFGKKKPVGAVCFIIGKQRIYSFLTVHINRSVGLLLISLAVACAVSLLVSLVVLVRYRSIQKRAQVKFPGEAVPAGSVAVNEFYDMTMPSAGPEPSGDETHVIVELLNVADTNAAVSADGDAGIQATPFHQKREIKDAIPAEKKE